MSVLCSRRGLVLSGGAYLAVIGSLFTGVYHPFTLVGLDRSWLILVAYVAVHLALGASWRTAWCYVLPAIPAVAGFLDASAHHNGWLVLAVFIGTPTALLLIAAGQLLALAAGRIGTGHLAPIIVAAALFLVALTPVAEAAREAYNLDTAPRLNSRLAQQLPLTVPALNTLCQQPLPASVRAEFTAAGQALIEETLRAGDSVVQASYEGADEDPGTHYELMTVRQLAEAQLAGLREIPRCDPALQLALQSAIG
jgi:hypothetical protein